MVRTRPIQPFMMVSMFFLLILSASMILRVWCCGMLLCKMSHEMSLNTKARYIRKSSLGRSRLICQSPLKCAGLIQNGGRFEFKKGKLYVNCSVFALFAFHLYKFFSRNHVYKRIINWYCTSICNVFSNNCSICNSESDPWGILILCLTVKHKNALSPFPMIRNLCLYIARLRV